jgi:tRNA threonylcarbamoyladenosine biosynthesis protein TsaB
MIICLETATSLCSVALCGKSGVVSLRESNETKTHASMLTVFIGEILREQGLKASDLDAVAVSKGPGSYTGLRIGVSVAKGIAYGASIPLIAVETTLSMFWGIKNQLGDSARPTLFCPMLDARRMEVYYAIYDSSGTKVKDIAAEIITGDSFRDIPETEQIIFFGDGALKCRDVISHKNTIFADDFSISASHMQKPVLKAFENSNFEDVAYFEPLYLKDFITSVPRKNILGRK